ncbi:MAG: FAD-binding oxidoreductase [Chlamydiia bacterium]|nr:FAD-binding oxidoreductase [Chlamydiia bacterium]
MKKVAIIGTGFSGLSLAYHLLKLGADVTLFDGKGIGGGASGIASGLLHPYPGERAFLSWKGQEGLQETRDLLKLVGNHVFKETGILRLAVTERQRKAFEERAKEQEDCEWWDEERCHDFLKGSHYLPGLFIRSGITVHARSYLEGLWKKCAELGGIFQKREVQLLDLSEFEVIALAAGGGIRRFREAKKLGIKWNKGQILLCKKPFYMKEEVSVIGKGYLAMGAEENRCFLGSTYEHEYVTESPCMGTATDLIFGQISQFLPSYASFEVEGCHAEIRVANKKGYHPLVGKLEEGLYVMTGMGSRGLLYHAYLGKRLAASIMKDSALPQEVAL